MTSIGDRFLAEIADAVAERVVRELGARIDALSPPTPSGWRESPERLLTPDEVAAILRAKKNTLAAWRMTPGAGPDFIKRGRLVFYTRGAIQAYLDRSTGD